MIFGKRSYFAAYLLLGLFLGLSDAFAQQDGDDVDASPVAKIIGVARDIYFPLVVA
jgi:hypothetical protein